VTTLKQWFARLKATSAYRAWDRYNTHNGGLLAGGISYVAFLSIFRVLALAFAVFGLVLRDQPGLINDIRDAINEQLPGFVKQGPDDPKGIITLSVPSGRTLSITFVAGLATLLWGGLGWLSSTRQGIRAIFGVEGTPGNFVLAKLRDLGVLVLIGLGIVASVLVSTAANGVAEWLAGLVGLSGQGWLFTVIGILAQLLLNTFIVALLLRLLSGVPLPWAGLRNGAIAGGVLLTLIQVFSTQLLSGTLNNNALAAVAIPAALLVYLNFIARALLLSASWAANDLDADTGRETSDGMEHKAMEGPAPQPLTTYRERTDAGLPTFGPRAGDRATLAAGAVLGAVGAFALGTARRGIRTLVRRR